MQRWNPGTWPQPEVVTASTPGGLRRQESRVCDPPSARFRWNPQVGGHLGSARPGPHCASGRVTRLVPGLGVAPPGRRAGSVVAAAFLYARGHRTVVRLVAARSQNDEESP